MKLSKDLKLKIVSYFTKKPEVEAVYLYGSQVKGSARSESDIDLAVLVNKKGQFGGFDIPQTRYTDDLEKITKKKVETQDLNSVSIDFAHRVLAEGELLLGLNSKIRVEFEEKVLRTYFDMKPFFDEYFASIHEIARKGELNVRYV